MHTASLHWLLGQQCCSHCLGACPAAWSLPCHRSLQSWAGLPWGHRRLGKVQLFDEALSDKQAVKEYKCIQPSEGIPSEVDRVVPVAFYSTSLACKIGTGFGWKRRVRGLPSPSRMTITDMGRAPAPGHCLCCQVPCSCRTEIHLDIYPSLSRQAEDMRLCCEPVSTTAFSSFPAHCKSKKRWEIMCGMQDEHQSVPELCCP